MNTWGPGSANPYARPDETRRTMAGLEDYCEDFFPSMGVRRLENLAANAMAADDNEILAPYYADALEAHSKLIEKCPGITKRNRIRKETAEYLIAGVECAELPHYYSVLADRLLSSRQWAIWGIDTAGELLLQWDGAAGLVKLCPDDAREEGQRVVEQYGMLLESHAACDRYELRVAVYTLKNRPLGELALMRDDLWNGYRDRILYAKKGGGTVRKLDDDRRLFPDLLGALATIEIPLSEHGDWNGHINVIEVWRRRPSYKDLRAAWGSNMRIQKLGGPRGWRPGEQSIRDAIVELVKYPLKHTSEKAEEKAGGGWSRAPGLTQWPYAAFLEWYEGHAGRRRTRSWGTLYGAPRPAPISKELTTWGGRLRFVDGVANPGAPIRHWPAQPALNLIQRNKSAEFGDFRASRAVDKSSGQSDPPTIVPAWLD